MKTIYILTAIISLTVLLCFSCKKDNKACWQAYDPAGADVTGLVLCDKTQTEAEATYPQYLFYNTTEAKYCWKLQNNTGTMFYARNVPQSIADKIYKPYGYTYSKVDCNSFCTWQILEKSKSKITNQYLPNKQFTETYTTDTCSKLFSGRIVIVRETTDSIITREFTQKK